MLKEKLAMCFMAISCFAFSQTENGRYIHKGLIRAMATISPGVLLEAKMNTISLHGNFDIYIDEDISLRSDGYYYMNTLDDEKPLVFNHSVFSGASYHFKTSSHIDPYIAFQPGIAIARSYGPYVITKTNQANPTDDDRAQYKTTADPLLSGVVGFNYYASKLFHLFIESRYVFGTHLSDAPGPTSLSEIKFSFGLGFNLN